MAKELSPRAVIAAIQGLREQYPTTRLDYVRCRVDGLYVASCRHFGSWENALAAARQPGTKRYDKISEPRKWTREAIINAIQERHRNNDPLNSAHMSQTTLYAAAYRVIGGWREAVTAAGLDYDKIKQSTWGGTGAARKWTKETVVAEILRRQREGLTIMSSKVDKEAPILKWEAFQLFGKNGWQKALAAAGIRLRQASVRYPWQEEDVVIAIKARHEQKLSLAVIDMMKTKPTTNLMAAAVRVFGSWKAAIEAAGLDYDKIRKMRAFRAWSNECVLQEIRARVYAGESIIASVVNRHDYNLYRQTCARFESWDQALVLAGGVSYTHIKARQLAQRPRKERERVRYPVIRVSLPRNWVSLDEPLTHYPGKTRGDFLGMEDPGFAQVEARHVLRTILEQNNLKPKMATLLERVVAGEDLEDRQYEILASVIREQCFTLLDTT